jgi:hypothetical protein
MKTTSPKLELHLDGPAVPGRISVDTLAGLATSLQTTLRRILSQRPGGSGRFGKEVEQACSLQLVAFQPGSANLVFELAAAPDSATLFERPGPQAIEQLLGLFDRAQSGGEHWNREVLPSVLDGLTDFTKPLEDGVTTMRLDFRDGSKSRSVTLTSAVRLNLRAAVRQVSEPGEMRLTGVIWECDWREHSGELHEPDGNKVNLEFGPELEETITEARRKRVVVKGRGMESGGRMRKVHVRTVEVVSDDEAGRSELYGRFGESLGIEELARRQGTIQATNPADLACDWPDDESVDDFLELIRPVHG